MIEARTRPDVGNVRGYPSSPVCVFRCAASSPANEAHRQQSEETNKQTNKQTKKYIYIYIQDQLKQTDTYRHEDGQTCRRVTHVREPYRNYLNSYFNSDLPDSLVVTFLSSFRRIYRINMARPACAPAACNTPDAQLGFT